MEKNRFYRKVAAIFIVGLILAAIVLPISAIRPVEDKIYDKDITVNSCGGKYKIGLKNNLWLSELKVEFDGKDIGTIRPGPRWGEFEVEKLPTNVKVSGGGRTWHKDLREYLLLMNLYKENLGVIDEVIKQNGKEIGLKIKIEYPTHLQVSEKGLLKVNVFTKDYGFASTPDFQHNIQTFCIIKVVSDESLREEDECGDFDKIMLVNPIVVGTITEPLEPFDGWLIYDNELRSNIEELFPDVSVTDGLIKAVEALILVPFKGLPLVAKAVELALETWVDFDFDEVCDAFAKWKKEYTIGTPPSNVFSNENDYDCWTYIYAFNIDKNLCTGANNVMLYFPFSFENSGKHEIRIHTDTMFEGISSFGVKGGRIGKEYSFDVKISESNPTPPEITNYIDKMISWYNENKDDLIMLAHDFVRGVFNLFDGLIEWWNENKDEIGKAINESVDSMK